MPVTPVFALRQDASFVYVDVRVPFVRVSDASLEYIIDGKNLSFFVKPYLLKLALPHDVVDDERAKASYDPIKDNGTVVLNLPKAEQGLHFEDLDLLTQLQQPRRSPAVHGSSINALNEKITDLDAERQALDRFINGNEDMTPELSASFVTPTPGARGDAPLIQVMSSVNFADEKSTSIAASSSNAESMDKLTGLFAKTELLEPDATAVVTGTSSSDRTLDMIKLHAPGQAAQQVILAAPHYGFGNKLNGFFKDIRSDFPELVDLVDPDETPASSRRALREADEDAAFDKERYESDFFGADQDPIFAEAMRFQGHLPSVGLVINEENESHGTNIFTSEEVDQMRNLTNREFLPFSVQELRQALCAILDVVISYCYDQRTTQGCSTVESAWTLRILSPTLSWLDSADHPRDALVAGMHRMLGYPYLRHLGLATTVLEDAALLLKGGKRAMLKCLLYAHRIMQKSEQFYMLNRLYLTDMCVWVQQADAVAVNEFCETTRNALAELLAKDPGQWIRFDIAIDLNDDEEEAEG